MGIVGTEVQDPPLVKVTDQDGNPVSGEEVEFSITQGGGTVSSSSEETDGAGTARLESWSLGPAAGWNLIQASTPEVGGSPLSFSAYAFPRFLEISTTGPQPTFATGVTFNRTRGMVTLANNRTGLWEMAPSGGGWTQLSPTMPGGARIYAVVHEARQQLLVISETQGPSYFDYGEGEWKTADLGDVPGARSYPGMVYDSANSRVLLYGGVLTGGSSNPVPELFEWDGDSWTKLPDPPAGRRGGHRMVYDPANAEVFIHGGTDFGNPTGGVAVQDTWVMRSSGEWEVIDTLPAPLAGFGMAFEENRRTLVLVGGTTVGSGGYGLSDQVWEHVNGEWVLSPIRSPGGPRVYNSLFFVPDTNQVILYGSEHAGWNDLWSYGGG